MILLLPLLVEMVLLFVEMVLLLVLVVVLFAGGTTLLLWPGDDESWLGFQTVAPRTPNMIARATNEAIQRDFVRWFCSLRTNTPFSASEELISYLPRSMLMMDPFVADIFLTSAFSSSLGARVSGSEVTDRTKVHVEDDDNDEKFRLA